MTHKQLIYFTIGHQVSYLQLANLNIQSLYRQGYDGDILFISDISPEQIKSSIAFKKEPLFLHTYSNDLALSSINKIKIYLYDGILEYNKIIFCDTDILWTSSPNNIFDLIQEDKIYIANELVRCEKPEHLMSTSYFGGNIFSKEDIDYINSHQVYGLNCGLFAFNNNMIPYFQDMYNILSHNPQYINSCLEQPFINFYLYKNNIYSTALNNHICHDGYHITKYGGTALHFAGGPGNYSQKFQTMNRYINENFQ
jgi:hypothetical protein